MFDITSCESPIPQLPLNQTILDATVTPPNNPNTFVFNGSIKKKKTQYSLKQTLEKQKKRSCSKILNNQKSQISLQSQLYSQRRSQPVENYFLGLKKTRIYY